MTSIEEKSTSSKKATFDRLIAQPPPSIAIAKQYLESMIEGLKECSGELIVGNAQVVDDQWKMLVKMKAMIEFLKGDIATLKPDGRLVFKKFAGNMMMIGTIKSFGNNVGPLLNAKYNITKDGNEPNNHSKYPPKARKVTLHAAQNCNEFKRPAIEDKEAYNTIYEMSLVTFGIVELQAQLATWVRLAYYISDIANGDKTMTKWLKLNRLKISDISKIETMHEVFSDLSNHEINPPGNNDPSASGVRYSTERIADHLKHKDDAQACYFAALAVQDQLRSGSGTPSLEEYKMFLATLEFICSSSPMPTEDTAQHKKAAENGWKCIFDDYKRYYVKKMEEQQKSLPVPIEELKMEHIDAQAYNAAMLSGEPPPEIRLKMSNDKPLEVRYDGKTVKANNGECSRVITCDYGRTGGAIIELEFSQNATLGRTYNDIGFSRGLVAKGHMYKMSISGDDPVGPMTIFGNNVSSSTKCMSDKVQRSDKRGRGQYIAELAQETVRDPNRYSFDEEIDSVEFIPNDAKRIKYDEGIPEDAEESDNAFG